METTGKQTQQKFKRREVKITSNYSRCLITKNISIPITVIGKNIQYTLEQDIKNKYEGKCLVEGYVKKDSTKIITHSSGLINRGIMISFQVAFECEVCFPVEGMLIKCVATDVTKAGIRGESAHDVPSPIIVFVARDHYCQPGMNYFSDVKKGDKFTARVIGQRFELNDKYVSVIAELVKPKTENEFGKNDYAKESTKPRLVIED
jgi:DNA-directed RNA polymerase subunit E'/Rpb7